MSKPNLHTSSQLMQQMGNGSAMHHQARQHADDAYTNLVMKHADNEMKRRELNKLQNHLNRLCDPQAEEIEFKPIAPPPITPVNHTKNIEKIFAITKKYRAATALIETDAIQIASEIKETQIAVKKQKANTTTTTPEQTNQVRPK